MNCEKKKIPKGFQYIKAKVKSSTEKSSQTGFVINGHNRKMESAIANLFPRAMNNLRKSLYRRICGKIYVYIMQHGNGP